MRKALTVKFVESVKPPTSGRLEITDSILPGLVLRVGANDYRSYLVRGRIHGHHGPVVRITLGSCALMPLAEARDEARTLLLAMRKGIDPREEKRIQEAQAVAARNTTFAAVVAQWDKEHLSRLRSYRESRRIVEKHLLPRWKNRQISDIKRGDIAAVIRGLQSTPGTAIRTLALCKNIFAWAASPARPEHEQLPVDPSLTLKPAQFGLTHGKRDTALSLAMLRAIWSACGEIEEPWAGDYIKLLLLSGQRRAEIAGLKWAEVSFDESVILLPASRMKSKKAHEVPLSTAMVDILNRLYPQTSSSGYVFGRSIDKSVITRMMTRFRRLVAERLEEGAELQQWTIHDLRRACRSGMGAAGVSVDVAERVLAHAMPNLIGTYDVHAYRSEKRRALEAWAQRLDGIVNPRENVVTPLLRRPA